MKISSRDFALCWNFCFYCSIYCPRRPACTAGDRFEAHLHAVLMCGCPICSFVVVVQSLSRVQFFITQWTAARQASLSFTISWSLLKLMSVVSVMPSNHLILCCPLLLPSAFPSIHLFLNWVVTKIQLHPAFQSQIPNTSNFQ